MPAASGADICVSLQDRLQCLALLRVTIGVERKQRTISLPEGGKLCELPWFSPQNLRSHVVVF